MRHKTRWSTITGLGLVLGLAACATPPPRGLLFVSFDTTRRDHLSVYGYSRPTTPVLAALARRGARFENAIAQQNLTLPSHASMLTGLYPHGHQSFSNEHILPESQVTLAEILHEAGFRTAAFVSGYPLDDNWGLDQGFEVYDDDFDGMGRRGELAVAGAIEWLDELAPEERFFLFVHLYDAHGPYRTPDDRLTFTSDEPGPRLTHIPEYQRLEAPDGTLLEHLNDYVDRYDTLIHYQDEVVGRLLDETDLETTVVLVVADHGEALDERVKKLNHGAALFDEEIRIPLLLAGPGIHPGRFEATAETVDLLPTLLELLDVAARPEVVHGRSLTSLLARRASGEPARRLTFSSSVAEPERFLDRGYELDTRRHIYAVRDTDWKLIVYPHASEDYVELYDLSDDPMERRNVAEQHPEVRGRLLTALESWYPGYREPISLANISEEERQRLRALGYIR